MRTPGIVLAIALVAIPALGHEGAPSTHIVHTLTTIDSIPTKEALTSALGATNELAALRQFALDPSIDFGMRLRAVRAMPHFCQNPQACHEAILAVFADVETSGDPQGRKILRLRAAIEALGVARLDLPGDLQLLQSYLNNPSRDLRATAARALRELCNPLALESLKARYVVDPSAQVKAAIDDAIHALEQCPH